MNPSNFDELTKALASSSSRRHALRLIVTTAVGGLLGLTSVSTAFGKHQRRTKIAKPTRSNRNDNCAKFCAAVFGPNTPAANTCTSDAAHNKNDSLCGQCNGDASKICCTTNGNYCDGTVAGATCCTGGAKCCGGTCVQAECCSDSDCRAGEACQGNICVCVPDCTGKECGSNDGCDGTCQTGTCPQDQTCQGGTCCVPRRGACTFDEDCCPGENGFNFCSGGLCLTASGGACTDSGDCSTFCCANGVCTSLMFC
jgi:hypothetical protein